MRLLTCVLLGSSALLAQSDGNAFKRELVEVHNFQPQDAINFLTAYGVKTVRDPSGRFVMISGNDRDVAAAVEALKRVDVKPRNVELTFYILNGLGQASGDSYSPDVEAVVKQLRTAFPQYKAYKLLETAIVRVNDGGKGEISGSLSPDGIYQIRASHVRIGDASPHSISIHDLKLGGRMLRNLMREGKPTAEYIDTGINTNIDFAEGQKIVVGKATVADQAAFLIVSAKVMN